MKKRKPRTDLAEFAGVPPWVATMRQAAVDAISVEDINEIVCNQVKLAKEGNPAAIKFVFDQVLGGQTLRGATFVQNNYTGGANPELPTKERPGSNGKLLAMQARADAGRPLCDDDDGPECDLS